MSVVKEVTQDGAMVSWLLNLKHNNSTTDCANARVTFTIPAGVRLVGPASEGSTVINVSKGYYNITTKIWYVGDLAKNEIISQALDFVVDDILLADSDDGGFLISALLESACVEAITTNNSDTLFIKVVDPCTQVSLSIGSGEETSSTNISIG